MSTRPAGSLLNQLRLFALREFRLAVPTVASRDDFVNLVAIRQALPPASKVVLDFNSCGRLPPEAIIFLGGLVALIRREGGSVRTLEATIKPKMRRQLTENGMLLHLGSTDRTVATGPLPFEHYQELDKSQIMRYLEDRWLGSGAVQLSPNLRAAIMGNAWEVYANAFEHSDSPIGIVNSGSFDRKKHQLLLSVMDLGMGIPESVRRFLRRRSADRPW